MQSLGPRPYPGEDTATTRDSDEYLEKNGYVQTHIVVELNEKILPKNMYEKTYLKEDDCLEILTFMGGG